MNCKCFYCQQGKQHKHSPGYNDKWENTGRLMVADSLDPKDILLTRTCSLCGHEEKRTAE